MRESDLNIKQHSTIIIIVIINPVATRIHKTIAASTIYIIERNARQENQLESNDRTTPDKTPPCMVTQRMPVRQ